MTEAEWRGSADPVPMLTFLHGKVSERKFQSAILRDICNPYCSVAITDASLMWNDRTIVRIAQAIYDERAFERLPVLADALAEAGCDDADILAHCRGPGPHVRGCWVVDLLLGKE